MNKKLLLGLGIVVSISSASFIAYEYKNNSEGTNSFKSNTSYVDTTTQGAVTEEGKTEASSKNTVEHKTESLNQNTVEHKTENLNQNTKQENKQNTEQNTKQENKQNTEQSTQQNVKHDTQQEVKQDAEQNIKQMTTQEKETYYYNTINEAMQKQSNYIKSLEPGTQVQSSIGAAYGEAMLLEMKYPEDADMIKGILEKVTKNNQQGDEQNIEQMTTQEKEAYYYNTINEAMQKQINYINSIEDPITKQSVQTSHSAAIAEATGLMSEYPEDAEIIKVSMKKVLNGTK